MELAITRRAPDGSWSNELPDWDSPSTLVQMFGPASMLDDPKPIEEVSLRYPNSVVVGCSGAGVLVDDEISDGDLVIVVARFRTVHLASAYSTVSASTDQRDLGRNVLDKLLLQNSNVSGVLLLTSGGGIAGDMLSDGFQSLDGVETIKVGGGLAGSMPGDDGSFRATWILDENRLPIEGAISAIGFSGDDLIFRNAARGGWKPLGPERIATRADAQTLRELDGRPALDLYKEYLGDEANALPAVASRFPLASRRLASGDDDWAPAGVLSVDEATSSMLLTRKIIEGSPVQMLRGYSGELFKAAEDAAADLNPIVAGTHLAIVTSCLGRRVCLGSRTADELNCVRQALPDNVGMAGFYGMGEFSSTSSTACKLYNYTMTLALIGESLP